MDGDVIVGSTARDRVRSERKFYSGMALFMVALVLIGFAPSFYFVGLVHYPRPNPTLTPSVILHGLALSLWMLLFVVQTTLISAGRRDIHRALGIGGFVYAVALIPLLYLMAVWQVARANQPPSIDPLTWTAVPLLGLPVYCIMLWQGWSNRNTPQAHKRLMLGLMIILMEPAIGRFPIAPPTVGGFAGLGILSWLLFVPLFIWDSRTLGQLHWATKLGAGIYAGLIAAQVTFLAFPGPWAAFAAHLPGIGS